MSISLNEHSPPRLIDYFIQKRTEKDIELNSAEDSQSLSLRESGCGQETKICVRRQNKLNSKAESFKLLQTEALFVVGFIVSEHLGQVSPAKRPLKVAHSLMSLNLLLLKRPHYCFALGVAPMGLRCFLPGLEA